MVRIEIYSAQHQGIAAYVEADADQYRIEGPLADLIDPGEPLLGLPSGRRVTAADAPEEWARGLIVRFRSPDLSAQIVADDDPLPANDAPVTVEAPAVI
jgi:hypothetical protein